MGPRGYPVASRLVKEADVILAIGTRLGFNSTFYSYENINDGEATIYAEKIQTKATDAAKPKNKINFHVYSMFENHSLKINCVVES